jgi:hypothetical protein
MCFVEQAVHGNKKDAFTRIFLGLCFLQNKVPVLSMIQMRLIIFG